jgi:hypothetical protein
VSTSGHATSVVAATAAIRWITKDGLGALGRSVVGGRFASVVDEDPKRCVYRACASSPYSGPTSHHLLAAWQVAHGSGGVRSGGQLLRAVHGAASRPVPGAFGGTHTVVRREHLG